MEHPDSAQNRWKQAKRPKLYPKKLENKKRVILTWCSRHGGSLTGCPLHVGGGDAPVGARAPHCGQVHPQVLGQLLGVRGGDDAAVGAGGGGRGSGGGGRWGRGRGSGGSGLGSLSGLQQQQRQRGSVG